MNDHDLLAAFQFNLLTRLGLREEDYLLDIGCGPLRAGRLFIPYLLPGRYFGIEPRRDDVLHGIETELGQDLVRLRRPTFDYGSDLGFSRFGQQFDFLLANSVFSHAPVHAIRSGLREAAKVMRPDALFLASFMRGSRNYEGDSWVFADDIDRGMPGRINSLTTYSASFMEDVCAEHGFLVDMLHGIHPGAQTWMVIRREMSGTTRDLVRSEMRRTYAHAPIVPDWPSRPSHIRPALW